MHVFEGIAEPIMDAQPSRNHSDLKSKGKNRSCVLKSHANTRKILWLLLILMQRSETSSVLDVFVKMQLETQGFIVLLYRERLFVRLILNKRQAIK